MKTLLLVHSKFQFLSFTDKQLEIIKEKQQIFDKVVFGIHVPYLQSSSENPLSYDMVVNMLKQELNTNDYTPIINGNIKNIGKIYQNYKISYVNLDNILDGNYYAQGYTDNKIFELGRRAGALETALAGYPKTIMCTDIAILSEHNTSIFLGKRDTEAKYRFIGGHVDSGKDQTLEECAKRELMEEAGSFESTPMQYVWGGMIDDPRYANSRDKIYSALFKTNIVFGKPDAGDDINVIQEFDIDILNSPILYFVEEHIPLAVALKNNLALNNGK